MKTPTLIITSLLVLGCLNWMIVAKERLQQSGRSVLCELTPVDPRSLIQGDYMILRYAVAEDAASHVAEDACDGYLIFSLDENDVAKFARMDNETPLADDEVRIRFRRRHQGFRRGMIRLGAESYFFQEGRAGDFSRAKYGELKVAPNGECILVGLRDVGLKPL
ncbi:MAG: GDYXXLXY domain-containing protein [Planctomycetales bacterium]|jgi:uncharacterized membrane-anchored protein